MYYEPSVMRTLIIIYEDRVKPEQLSYLNKKFTVFLFGVI